jgi:hypothetical protein
MIPQVNETSRPSLVNRENRVIPIVERYLMQFIGIPKDDYRNQLKAFLLNQLTLLKKKMNLQFCQIVLIVYAYISYQLFYWELNRLTEKEKCF